MLYLVVFPIHFIFNTFYLGQTVRFLTAATSFHQFFGRRADGLGAVKPTDGVRRGVFPSGQELGGTRGPTLSWVTQNYKNTPEKTIQSIKSAVSDPTNCFID